MKNLSDGKATIVEIILAEYNVLRDEIYLYHEQQKHIMNFVLLAILGMFAVITVTEISDFLFCLLFFPLIYSGLAILYADRTIRIIRLADYIHNHLRKNILKLIDDGVNIWQWEIYKRHTKVVNRKLALFLDRGRWIIFILPSIFSILTFLFFHIGLTWLNYEIFLTILSIVTVSLTIVMTFIVEETKGIKDTASENLNNYDKT